MSTALSRELNQKVRRIVAIEYRECGECGEAVSSLYDGGICSQCYIDGGGSAYRLPDLREWCSSPEWADVTETIGMGL